MATRPLTRNLQLIPLILAGCITHQNLGLENQPAKQAPASVEVQSPNARVISASVLPNGTIPGAVVAAHPLASEAGIKMLENGGNAVDAAVAASFVISVVRPQSTGIGGGGFMLTHSAKHKRTEVFDFRERAPEKATAELYSKLPPEATIDGPMAVAIPGLVAGLAEIHSISGRLPWKTVLEPAIQIAAEGFPVYSQLADALKKRQEILAKYPSSTKIFFADGRPLEEGALLIQSDLAATLRRIAANGATEFSQGETAKRIVASLEKNGGILTAEDLKNYRVQRRTPVTAAFGKNKIISMPPPSSGGVHVIEILNILRNDHQTIKRSGFGSFTHWHLMAEAMKRAFADRAVFMGDPDYTVIPVDRLVSLAHADSWRKTIDAQKAVPSNQLDVKNPGLLNESDSTTHISVVDKEGNAVATTQTINFTFGSCLVADDTGIILNDEMDDFSRSQSQPNVFGLVGSASNEIAPGKTPLSSMTPTMIFDANGKLKMIAGSPGGPRIISATLQTIFNHLALQMSPEASVQSPRIHHQWRPDKLYIERSNTPAATLQALEVAGHQLADSGTIGDVQAIFIEQDEETGKTTLSGVSDRRSDGQPRLQTLND